MLKIDTVRQHDKYAVKSRALSLLRRFAREEDGSVIVFTLLLLIFMLVIGGMAVDFMHYESRRAALQSVSDRAVLAAAELDQPLDRVEVVRDYFKKAGFEGAIVGNPTSTGSTANRTVSVEAELNLDTFYLRMIGIDELKAPAQSTATEGVGHIEISLVLDISGSMYTEVSGPNNRRIDSLQVAATSFVNKLITPGNAGQISLSLVPYSAQVNAGDDLFRAVGMRPGQFLDRSGDLARRYLHRIEDSGNATFLDGDGNVLEVGNASSSPGGYDEKPLAGASVRENNAGQLVVENPARCVDFPVGTAYKTTVFNNTGLQQSQAWQSNAWGQGGWAGARPGTRNQDNRLLDQPLCPNGANEEIIPLSQNATQLTQAIAGLEPRGGTSIFLGVKWGTLLLDPSFRDVIQRLPGRVVHPDFRTTRPADYPDANSETKTAKYLILMTDGQNSDSSQLKAEYYDEAEDVFRWANFNLPNYRRRRDFYGAGDEFGYRPSTAQLTQDLYSDTDGDKYLQDICSAAKKREIIIYTIAMDAQTHGENEMRKCASKPSFFFATSGDEVDAIFDKIADQITDLRLTL